MNKYSFDRNFRTERADGRFDRSLGFIHHYISLRKHKLAFDTVSDATAFPQWRQHVKEKVRELLCMIPDPKPEFVMLREEKRDDYRIQWWELYPEDGLAVPFLMLIPEKVIATGQPAPAVVCTPGSGAGKESLAGEPCACPNRFPLRNRQAWWYVKAGMIVIATDNPGLAKSGEPDMEDYGKAAIRFRIQLMRCGRTYRGFVTEQRLMMFEFLKKHPLVDPACLAVSGLSLGCTGTLYPMLLNDDIAAMVYCDFVCDQTIRLLATTDFHSDDFPSIDFLPGETEWFSIQPDLVAALAPRRILLAEGGPWIGHVETVVRAYEMLGMRDRLTLHYYPKYSTIESRSHDGDDLRQARGITPEEYLQWANVDVSQHSFHPDLAIPWLKEIFFGDEVELFDNPEMMLELQRAKEETEHFFTVDGKPRPFPTSGGK